MEDKIKTGSGCPEPSDWVDHLNKAPPFSKPRRNTIYRIRLNFNSHVERVLGGGESWINPPRGPDS